MNTALFLLRCLQVGLCMEDLDRLSIGMVLDIFSEKQNDGLKYKQLATQEDFNKF